MAQAQNFENHAMYVPAFHFVAIPIFTLNVGWSIYRVAHVFSGDTVIALLVAVALLLLAFNARIFALKVQDRVIRLEERLRLAQLLPEATRSRIAELSEPQLIALRFASDGEVAGLVQQTLDGKWDPKQIKGAVKVWRPDFFRV